jgi:hypothetical protein
VCVEVFNCTVLCRGLYIKVNIYFNGALVGMCQSMMKMHGRNSIKLTDLLVYSVRELVYAALLPVSVSPTVHNCV